MRVTDPSVQEAVRDGRVEYIGKRRGQRGYMGQISRSWLDDKGHRWYEIDINCIGGVPSPMAKRGVNPLKALFGRSKGS